MRRSFSRTAAVGAALLVSLALSSLAQAKHKRDKDDDADDDDAKTAAEPAREFRFEFGLVGGLHIFDSQSGLGRFTDSPPEVSPKTGGAFGARLGLNFNRYLTLEGEFLWIPTRTVLALDSGGTKINVFAYRGSLLVHLAPPGIVRPFVVLGYGALSSISNDSTVAFSDNDGLLHAGLGLKIGLGDYVGLRFEGRVLAPPAFLGHKVAIGDETDFHGPDYEALGTLYFNFGEVERIEIVKEERVVVEKNISAPNLDPDGDGIAGAADKCPNVAEDKDGFEDEDGCPDDDNDKDGIPDLKDKCPDKPETVNGIDDDDGCPEIDTDGDGILGSRDKCPDEPETKNGYKDDDGCPDELPAAIKKFTGVIEGINFKSGRATILPGSYVVLDRAVAALTEFPEIRLEISGHTDSRGKADKNRDLSQARADSVKMYFISRGIDAGRLTSIGYGSERPVDSNTSDSGRAHNRRTEFRVLMAAPEGNIDKTDKK